MTGLTKEQRDENWGWFVKACEVEGIKVPDGLRETLEAERDLPHEERIRRAVERARSGHWREPSTDN